jgi:hypothetical protein
VAINERSRDHRIFIFFVNLGPSGERKKVVNGKMHDNEHDKQNINIDINVNSNWPALDGQIFKLIDKLQSK